MSRKVARESAYKLVFEYLFNMQPNERTFRIFTNGDLDEKDKNYLEKVYYGVISHYDVIMPYITKYSEGFSQDRIYRTDLSAMLIAVYEMLYLSDDVPMNVSISEAVELVKKYSTEKSNQFVNGLLSSVYKEINAKGPKDDGNN